MKNMETISALAKRYYIEFEKNDWGSIWTWASILAWLVFFVVGLYMFLTIPKFSINDEWQFILPLVGLELFGIFSLEKARGLRRKAILGKYNSVYSDMYCRNRFLDVDACKRHFLLTNIARLEDEYLLLAQDIEKAIELQDLLRPSLNKTLSQWPLYIYDPESKPRINALFIMLFSTIVLLSSREGASIANVFEFYEGFTLLLGLLLMAYIVLLFSFVILTQSLIRFLWGTIFPEENAELRYLMRDLLKFHRYVGAREVGV